MSIEAGRAYFRQFGMEDRVQEFTVSSATVDLAAKALALRARGSQKRCRSRRRTAAC